MQFWSLEPPGSMVPMGTQCTTWQWKMGCWSIPPMRRGAWDASACSLRMAWLIIRPTLGRGSPKTWWRSSVTCTTRWRHTHLYAHRQAQVNSLLHAEIHLFRDKSTEQLIVQPSWHQTMYLSKWCCIIIFSTAISVVTYEDICMSVRVTDQ